MLSYLTAMAVFGLAGTGLGALTRALPWPSAWKKHKPLGCATCLGGWGSLAMLVMYNARALIAPFTDPTQVFIVWMGATGIAALLLTKTGLFTDPIEGLF
jgi:hypothetical protein